MEITFLGTGTSQGVPLIGCDCEVCTSANPQNKRLRSSVLVRTENCTLLIDAGPDFREQMLREKVRKLDAVLLTHEHKDHISGLDGVRVFNYLQKKPMDVYAEERVCNLLRTRDFAYLEERKDYPGIPKIVFKVIDNNVFDIGGISVMPVRGMHMQLPIFGYRIKNFAYLTDMSYISKREKEKLKNLDLLVINALRRKKHISHFSLSEAVEIIEELKPKKALLTHIGHDLSPEHEDIKALPKNIALAYDQLKVLV